MVSPLRKQRDIDRKESTREDLLNAAVDLFYEKGYHNALIADIVNKAGVGQGTFYRYFQNKRDLIDNVMDQFGQMLLGQFQFMTDHLPSNVDEYRAASRNALFATATLVEQNNKLTLLLLREGSTVDREFEQRINDLYDGFATLAAFYLDDAIANGFARPCNTKIVAQALVGIGLRHTTLWLNGEYSTRDINELVDELVDFAFLGFGTWSK